MRRCPVVPAGRRAPPMPHAGIGRTLLAALCLLLGLAGCGTDGPNFRGEAPDAFVTYGECAFCHTALATRMTETGGHYDLDLKCEACHENLVPPGEVGPGHRSVPRCRDCHLDQETHHDPVVGTATECTQCHTPHGSRNLLLVRELIATPMGGTRPVDFTNRDGMVDGSYASASDPGTGVCEICHTTTQFYRDDGGGAEHFVSNCIVCHGHEAGFAVSISPEECEVCHGEIVAQMDATGGHGTVDSDCLVCHESLRPGFGRGHRVVPRCADCHLEQETHHDPAVGTATECTQCHTPHGSPNVLLVRALIATPMGGTRPVDFTSRDGMADGSYASASDPGTGVCEICHTTTQFYRDDGGGAEHFVSNCIVCHGHEAGFAASISPEECEVCHGEVAAQMDATGGHGTVDSDCLACHESLRPGFGLGHRSVPRCRDCHLDQETHHDPVVGTATECTQCHTPHGSRNLLLVRELIATPMSGTRPVEFTNRSGLADGSYASASDPGTGVCEICHTTTQFYRDDGGGAEHFVSNCIACHGHEAGFAVSISPEECEVCHGAIAEQMDTTGGHGVLGANCPVCHADLLPGDFGPGHRSVPVCADCHPDNVTHHDPVVGTATECTQCHTPHGSPNLLLVRALIATPMGGTVPVTFLNRDGLADGSYTSVSDPGSGVCEICHTATQFYRSDGSGLPHFTFTCVFCHLHTAAFSPP